jgi:cell division protein FtsW
MKIAVTTLACCVAALLALGMVMLYSSSMSQVGAHYLMMQLLWCAFGLGLCVLAVAFDYRWLKRITWPFYAIAVVLLVLVLAPLPHDITRRINGARRWFIFHGVRFQPSELAKLALIIALAWYGEYFQRQMHTWKKGVVWPGLIIALVLVPLFVEPDRGTTVLLAAVSGAMLMLAGVRWRYILPPVCLAVVGLAWSLWHDPVRRERILAFLYPEKYKDGAGYQTWQAVLAFGSGGWFGEGLGDSRQKLGFIPEHHTDFILPVIGEELGLVATLAVLLVFVVIFFCGIYIAYRARDPFSHLLAAGISLLIALQACINIGVVTSSLPNKGIALPFISYGGSNLLAMLTCVGLLLGIARRAGAIEGIMRESLEPSEVPQSA